MSDYIGSHGGGPENRAPLDKVDSLEGQGKTVLPREVHKEPQGV